MFTEDEKKQLQESSLNAAEHVKEIYRNIEITDGSITFVCHSGKIQTYYIAIGWNEGGTGENLKVVNDRIPGETNLGGRPSQEPDSSVMVIV